MNQPDALKQFTAVVADSGDIQSVRDYQPRDATTNPSLALKAAALPACQPLIDDAVRYGNLLGGNKETPTIEASDRLAVNQGVEILKSIPGRISTEIDARVSFHRGMWVAKAEKRVRMYKEHKIDWSRILIKSAATPEEIKTTEEPEQQGTYCNLTLPFSFAQPRACAEAGAHLMSTLVGRISDWYQSRHAEISYPPKKDPGVKSVRRIYDYYKKHRYSTLIMGASFRNTGQVPDMAGSDRLTISPELLHVLKSNPSSVEQQLQEPVEAFHQPAPLSDAEFRWQHNQEAMAADKLAEGIRQFASDQQTLGDMLAARTLVA